MISSLDSERAVIGSVLQDGSTFRECYELTVDDFTDYFCRTVFTAEQALWQAGEKIDIITVGTWISSRSGDKASVKEMLMAAVEPTSANIRTYIKTVKDASTRRKIRSLASALADDALDQTKPVDTLLEDFKLKASQAAGGAGEWMSMAQMAMKGFDWLEKKSAGKVSCVQSGISTLDYIIGGFYQNELTLLAARPSVGKSSLGLFIAMNAARSGKKVAMVSREMSPEAIFQRAISNESPALRGERIRKSKLEEQEWIAMADAIDSMSRYSLSTIYTVRTVEKLRTQALYLQDRQGLDFLIVDYAQLMHTSGTKASRVDELEAVSGALKEIAMDLRIPVLALAQVKRSGSRTPIMPTMDELKGTGAFEQDADGILLMHRCEVEGDPCVNTQDKGLFQKIARDGKQYIAVHIAKQRHGQTGIVNMIFDPSHMIYTPIVRW